MIEKHTSNVIRYKGTVIVKKIDKNGHVTSTVKCNEGRQGLFNCVLFALAYNYTPAYCPYAIMGYSDEDNKDTAHYASQAIFTMLTPQTHAPVLYKPQGDADWIQTATPPVGKVEYSFLVPSANIVSNASLQSLKLFNRKAYDESAAFENVDDTNVCAYFKLDSALTLERGENLIIYWDMEFSTSK